MTNQEIFNKVWKHLKKQNHPALNNSGTCVYRTKNGLKCAIGCLIPKKLYTLELEGESIYGLRDLYGTPKLKNILPKVGIKKQSYKLCENLQEIHDSAEYIDLVEYESYWDFWKPRLISCAKNFRLKLPEKE